MDTDTHSDRRVATTDDQPNTLVNTRVTPQAPVFDPDGQTSGGVACPV